MNHRKLGIEGGLFALALAALSGCAGSQPKQSGEGDNFDQTPSSTASASADSTPSGSATAEAEAAPKWNSKPSPKEEPLNDAQKEQMEIALRRGGDKASKCASVVPDAKAGEGEVKVTFDGKKGRAVDVAVGPPWAGTSAESCIKRAFVGEIIVPFEGELEVPYTIKIAGAAAPADTKGGKPKKK